MTMPDPLTSRHGAFISQTWSIIAEARCVARASPTVAQCATQVRRLRFLRSKVLALHRTEMQRPDASTLAIDSWFQPVEQSLAKAEAYFTRCILMKRTKRQMAFAPDGTRTAAA